MVRHWYIDYQKTWLLSMLLLYFVLSVALPVYADVRLPAVFGDHMVLQRDMPLTFWGWADPGEQITLSLDGNSYQITTDSDSTWTISTAPISVGDPYTITITGNNRIELADVLAGEVWLASGQSNMEMRLRHIENAPQELAESIHWDIRLFQVAGDLAPEPKSDCEGRWEICRPSTANGFSAAAYFFGRAIRDSLKVPVGLVHSSWGGTSAETWMRSDAGAYSEEYRRLSELWAPTLEENRDSILEYFRLMSMWEEDVHDAEYAGVPYQVYATPPRTNPSLGHCPQMPAWVYNAMLAPLVPFPLRGVIWYQGETNAGRAHEYRSLFPALIDDWRRMWGQGDFPFIYVQLANFMQSKPEPGESTWAELREAQLLTLSVPNTAMASAIDIGLADNVHPLNKQEVGRRLALAALHITYGYDIVYSGPVYESMSISGTTVTLSFTHVGSGLKAGRNEQLSGFAIAGADRKFVWADARIVGDTVVVKNDKITDPVAVRYSWADNPDGNLYNKEGLPASSFRTDDWPGITENR